MKWFIIIVSIGVLLFLMVKYPKESRTFFSILTRIGKRIAKSILFMFSSKNAPQNIHSKENNNDNSAKVNIEIEQLKKDILNISDQFNKLKEIVNNMAVSQKEAYDNFVNRISKFEEKVESFKINAEKKGIEKPVYSSEEVSRQTHQEAESRNLLYAANVDSISPLGFFVSRLSNKYSGQYFEIERVSSNDALYRIVDDCNIHKLMIPTMYQMINNGICEIENKINIAPTYIQTLVDGHLKLKDGIWKITQKTIIKIA